VRSLRASRLAVRWGVAIASAAVVACASAVPPPGGPPRKDPPELIEVVPESNSVNVRTSRVVFRFDEVVSERPASGAEDLSGDFLISPRKGNPEVSWHRDHYSVSPPGGFRPNTVYTVTMLPGVADLHGNVQKHGATVTFSTGPTIPPTIVRGRVFDWLEGRVAANAFIDAFQQPIPQKAKDTVDYVTVADSTGAFVLRHLPPGQYTVRGYVDANNNRRLDPNEIWDSARVTLVDSARVELLAFVHDTVGPRVREIVVRDSVTVRVTLDQGIEPNQPLTAALFTITAKDSSTVPIKVVESAEQYDSAEVAAQRQRADSVVRADSLRRVDSGLATRDTTAARRRRELRQAQRDSAARAKLLHPSLPSPVHEVVLVLGSPLQPGATYRLHLEGLRGILGATRPSTRSFSVPKVVSDSARARADSLRKRSPPGVAPPSGTPPAAPPG
jgi:Bacterial Ig-like domain